MKKVSVSFKNNWKVIPGSRRSQAAILVIPKGQSEGGPDNKHNADQWLLVYSGSGVAVVNKRTQRIRRGTLLFIKAGEKHEIKNTGRSDLKTLNFYAPPSFGNR